MKTPLPEPVHIGWASDGKAPRFGYTADQLRAAMVAAYREGVEDAAKVCEVRANPENILYVGVGAVDCADAIRKLKEQSKC